MELWIARMVNDLINMIKRAQEEIRDKKKGDKVDRNKQVVDSR